MTKPRRIVAVLSCACVLTACGGREESHTVNTATPNSVDTRIHTDLPTPETLHTSLDDPDEIAIHFVQILETHDTALEADEWTSLKRAVPLMTESAAKAQLKNTEGGSATDWAEWQESNAFVAPAVAFTHDAKPADTPLTVHRIVKAQLTPQLPGGEKMPPRERVHFVTLEKQWGEWKISVWTTGPLEDSHVQEAGEASREDTAERTSP